LIGKEGEPPVNWKNARHVRILIAALSVIGIATVGAYAVGSSTSASAAGSARALGVPFGAASIPSPARRAVEDFATSAQVASSSLLEVGRSPSDQPYRATIVGYDHAGTVHAAIATDAAVTNFARASQLFRAGPVVALTSSSGTTTEVREVGLTVLIESPVTRVDVVSESGTIRALDVVWWPRGDYASGSSVATERSLFPTQVLGYDVAGNLIAKRDVGVSPLCPAVDPKCIE